MIHSQKTIYHHHSRIWSYYASNKLELCNRFAATAGDNDPHLQKVLQKHQENSKGVSYGTIPYLGTFLTDLVMIDTAVPDVVDEGLINFDKRRKEFEILAQVGRENCDRDNKHKKQSSRVLEHKT